MSTDSRPARPVTISIPSQRQGDADVLSAGPSGAAPALAERPSRWRAPLATTAALAVAAALLAGSPPWAAAPAEPDRAEPVSFSLLTPAPTATARPAGDGPAAFVTLRVRVAVRNDTASWVTLADASLGPYRAVGDGLGALPPGGLTSLPLERLVVCDAPAAAPPPRFLELDVVGGSGPSQLFLGLAEPAGTDPATALPACT